MSKGFTLVELSIVLVIIGLLIGGILSAQSMISTVKIQSAVRIIQQYDIAVTNFQTKYNGLPGDSIAFGGNGDGIIHDASNTSNNAKFDGEVANFWVDLQQSGFDPNDPTYTATVPAGGADGSGNRIGGLNSDSANPNTPMFPIGKNTCVYIITASSPNGGYVNGYLLDDIYKGDIGGGDTVFGATIPMMDPVDAVAIDVKMDDGNPETGIIVAVLYDYSAAAYSNCDSFDGTDTASAKYNVGVPGAECYLTIGMQGAAILHGGLI